MVAAVGLRSVSACVESCLTPRAATPWAGSMYQHGHDHAKLPGVIVLALDGLAYHAAAAALEHAELAALRSTFPSTSATAWLTSVTGLEASEHGVVGTVYREPGTDRLVDVITGETTAPFETAPATEETQPPVLTFPTIFDKARTLGAEPLAIGAELAAPRGPWISALLHGATLRVDNPTPALTVSAIVERIARDVEAVIGQPRTDPLLLWAYVNLDGHVHRNGYDAALLAALRFLDETADRWADRGWTVLAHADHGQVPVTPDPELAARWAALDQPRHCRIPSGGAGRVRWLHPRAGHEERLARELRAALGEHAFVFTPDELDDRGLMSVSPIVRARIGEIVAVAASPRFPVPDPSSAYEHGSITEDELLVPFAAWGAPVPVPAPALAGRAPTPPA